MDTKYSRNFTRLNNGDEILFVQNGKFRWLATVVDKFKIRPRENIYRQENGKKSSLGFQVQIRRNISIPYHIVADTLYDSRYYPWRNPTRLTSEQTDIVKGILQELDSHKHPLSESDSDSDLHLDSDNETVGSQSKDDVESVDNDNDNGSDTESQDDDNMQWEVKKICDSKMIRGRRFYKVQWASTWEPEDNVGGAQEAIRAFQKKNRKRN